MMKDKMFEYGQDTVNTNIVDHTYMETVMPETNYNKVETEKSGMKICFLFPSKTEENTEIRKDIKAILAGALREQMEQRTH